jgi:pyruvyltransferase
VDHLYLYVWFCGFSNWIVLTRVSELIPEPARRQPLDGHNAAHMVKRVYWYNVQNFGDSLTPIIFGHFAREPFERATRHETGKVLGIGSILSLIREDDIVVGSGLIRQRTLVVPAGVHILQVRGPLSRILVSGDAAGAACYGDPALLLPEVYRPTIERKYDCGYVPHYVDMAEVWDREACECTRDQAARCAYCKRQLGERGKIINVRHDWKTVIDDILSCRMIVASSLHGLICAEAYGIPTIWMRYSDRIIGGEFKFQDHFLGTGRPCQRTGEVLPPIRNLERIQEQTITVIQSIL